MRAKLEKKGAGVQFVLALIPDSREDSLALQDLSRATSKTHNFFFRGFEYMSPEVEFIIQKTVSDN